MKNGSSTNRVTACSQTKIASFAFVFFLDTQFEHRNQIFIVMELCSGGDLYTRDPYTEEEAARIVTSIVSAISYMHSKNICHRDLKVRTFNGWMDHEGLISVVRKKNASLITSICSFLVSSTKISCLSMIRPKRRSSSLISVYPRSTETKNWRKALGPCESLMFLITTSESCANLYWQYFALSFRDAMYY